MIEADQIRSALAAAFESQVVKLFAVLCDRGNSVDAQGHFQNGFGIACRAYDDALSARVGKKGS